MIALLLFLAATVPDLSWVLKLSNGSNLAQACPISMDKALTNRHVANASTEWIWGVAEGEQFHGIARTGDVDIYRDLGFIRPVTVARFPHWYQIAKFAPKAGDRIWFIGFDWRKGKDGFAPRTFPAEVLRIFNGNLIFKSAGAPGSSGSCILNEAGEVVAINQGGKDMEDKQEDGTGVGIWGDWLSLKPDEDPPAEEPHEYKFNFPWKVRR